MFHDLFFDLLKNPVCVFFIFVALGLHANEEIDLSEALQSIGVSTEASALYIICLEDDKEWITGGDRIDRPYPPASTAKIPHTLIALEEGYANDLDAHFDWDGKERFLEVWNQNQTLLSAFKYSVVWVYQKITRDLGYEIMANWIYRFGYGNRNIGSFENITTYWLDGPLEISARGQVRFLGKLAMERLPLKTATYHASRKIMLENSGDNWELYAKTGFSGGIGWYVGWVEKTEENQKQTYVFAFNMDVASWDELPLRKKAVRIALEELGVIALR